MSSEYRNFFEDALYGLGGSEFDDAYAKSRSGREAIQVPGEFSDAVEPIEPLGHPELGEAVWTDSGRQKRVQRGNPAQQGAPERYPSAATKDAPGAASSRTEFMTQ